jgi:hypothetical protein
MVNPVLAPLSPNPRGVYSDSTHGSGLYSAGLVGPGRVARSLSVALADEFTFEGTKVACSVRGFRRVALKA